MRYIAYVEIFEYERLPGLHGILELDDQKAAEILAAAKDGWVDVADLSFDPADCDDLTLPATVNVEASVILYYE